MNANGFPKKPTDISMQDYNYLPSNDKNSSVLSFEIHRISSNRRILLKLKSNL